MVEENGWGKCKTPRIFTKSLSVVASEQFNFLAFALELLGKNGFTERRAKNIVITDSKNI